MLAALKFITVPLSLGYTYSLILYPFNVTVLSCHILVSLFIHENRNSLFSSLKEKGKLPSICPHIGPRNCRYGELTWRVFYAG